MRAKRATVQRRGDRKAARKDAASFRPGRGRQLACLTGEVHRTDGVMAEMFERGNRDTELFALDYRWNHPRMIDIRNYLDAEEPGWATVFKWPRSQLLYPYIVALHYGCDLKSAYNKVRTDPDIRRIGGFAMRPPDAAEREGRGEPQKRTDPAFPLLQSINDFANRWLAGGIPSRNDPLIEESFVREQPISDRGKCFLALVEKATQEIAFEAILRYKLNPARLVLDTSIVLSAHKHDRPCRTDYGAGPIVRRKGDEEKKNWGRLLGSVILVDCPFVVSSDIAYYDSEKTMLKRSMLPRAAAASRWLVEFATERGVSHPGFAKALMCGDGQFHDHPDIEATFAHGFLPGYNIGGDKREIVGPRLLTTTNGKEAVVDLRDDGAHLCRCEASCAQPTREPMPRKIVEVGRSARVTCPYCAVTYLTTPRGADEETAGGERGDIDLRYDITVPRWDKRAIAYSFKARNLIEGVHSALRAMSLLPNGRGGKDWRPITGDFRHRLWYGLGYLMWNITIEFNLDRKEDRPEYTPAEGFAAFQRNRHQMARDEKLAERYPRTRRKPQPPRHPAKGKSVPLCAAPITRRSTTDLGSALSARAALLRTPRTRPSV